jgi:hypothetical protein
MQIKSTMRHHFTPHQISKNLASGYPTVDEDIKLIQIGRRGRGLHGLIMVKTNLCYLLKFGMHTLDPRYFGFWRCVVRHTHTHTHKMNYI